jgi:uncharacterized repeat protein (TIGR02543 family)
MIKNIFTNIQNELGSDFVLYYFEKAQSLTEAELKLYANKTIGVFYVNNGSYLPLRGLKGLTVDIILSLLIPADSDVLQQVQYAFDTLVQNRNGKLEYDGAMYDYVLTCQYPVPVGNVENIYGNRRQPYQITLQASISQDVLLGNAAKIKVDGIELDGVTLISDTNSIQTQTTLNINSYYSKKAALFGGYGVRVMGYITASPVWSRLRADYLSEQKKLYVVEVDYGGGASKEFVAVLSSVVTTAELSNFQIAELIFEEATEDVLVQITFDANGGEWLDKQTYSIVYFANGGTGEMIDPNSPYEAGAIATVLENQFERTNHNFVGWNTLPDGTGSSYVAGNLIAMNADIVLYAQWVEASGYRVSYNPNGGTSAVNDPTYYPDGALVYVKFTPTPTRTGYTFIGWGDTPSSITPSYTEDGVTSFTITANRDLFCVWRTTNVVMVNFTSTEITVTADNAVASDIEIEVGYEQGGTYLYTTIELAEGETEASESISGVSALLYAKSTPKYDDTYYYKAMIGTTPVEFRRITYYPNGGTGSAFSTYTEQGASVTLQTNTFTYEPYTFIGWATSPGGDVVYQDEATITVTQDLNLYAVWGNTVTFNANGGLWED